MLQFACMDLPAVAQSHMAIVAASERRRSGVPFRPEAEAALAPLLIDIASELARGRDIVAIPEFIGPFGVADLVAVYNGQEWYLVRRANGVPPVLNEVDALVLGAASVRFGRSVAELAARTHLPGHALDTSISRLRRIGALSQRSDDRLVRAGGFAPAQLHAIEAKVDDWRRGLSQAQRYALWADQVTLVLGGAPRRIEELQQALMKTRIGLAIAGELVRRPKRTLLPLGRRMWAAEHLFAMLGGTRA